MPGPRPSGTIVKFTPRVAGVEAQRSPQRTSRRGSDHSDLDGDAWNGRDAWLGAPFGRPQPPGRCTKVVLTLLRRMKPTFHRLQADVAHGIQGTGSITQERDDYVVPEGTSVVEPGGWGRSAAEPPANVSARFRLNPISMRGTSRDAWLG